MTRASCRTSGSSTWLRVTKVPGLRSLKNAASSTAIPKLSRKGLEPPEVMTHESLEIRLSFPLALQQFTHEHQTVRQRS